MNLGIVFPRNVDGTLKRKQPCQTPGCKWPNWHICLDKNDPKYREVQTVKTTRYKMTPEHRAKLSEAQSRRQAEKRAAFKERDALIVKHYTEGGLGMNQIAPLLGIAQSTVNKVLKRAQDEGLVTIRPVGRNLFHRSTR